MGSGEKKSQSASTARATDGAVAGERSGSAAEPTLLGRRFSFGLRVIVNALRLEENSVLCVTPEVCHRITAVAPTSDDLQAPRTTPIWTWFTFVLKIQIS